MSPQPVDKPNQEGRVIPLVPRTLAARGATHTTERDWVAWACLGLGILCGAGAVYFALIAIRE